MATKLSLSKETGLRDLAEFAAYWRLGNNQYLDDFDPNQLVDLLRNDLAVASQEIERLLSLIRAVKSGEFGIVAEDVDGQNWFDARSDVV